MSTKFDIILYKVGKGLYSLVQYEKADGPKYNQSELMLVNQRPA